MEPYVYIEDADFKLICGDALQGLQGLPDESVHCVATSSPFYGLRDYGVEGQIGLEASPDEWAARLVAVFAECRRVLRSDGSLWIECGDSYGSGGSGGSGEASAKQVTNHGSYTSFPKVKGIKPKDLLSRWPHRADRGPGVARSDDRLGRLTRH